VNKRSANGGLIGIAAGLVLLYVPSMASSAVFIGVGMQSIDQKVDDKIDDKVDEKVEQKIDDKIDQKVDDKVDQKIDDKVDQKVDDKVDQKIDDKVDQKVDDKVDQKVDQKVDDKVDEKVDDKVDTGVTQSVDTKVDVSVSQDVDSKLNEELTAKVDASIGHSASNATDRAEDAGFDKKVEDKLPKGLSTRPEHHLETGAHRSGDMGLDQVRREEDTSDTRDASDKGGHRTSEPIGQLSVSESDLKKAIQSRFDLALAQADAIHRAEKSMAEAVYELAIAEARRVRDSELAEGLKDPKQIEDDYRNALDVAKSTHDEAIDLADSNYDQTLDTQKEQEDSQLAEVESFDDRSTSSGANDNEDSLVINATRVGDSRDLRDMDVDPDGFSIARGEWLVLGSPSDVANISAAGFRLRSEEPLDGLSQVVARVASPTGQAAEQAEAHLRKLAPTAIIDYNHLYSPQLASHSHSASGSRPRDALSLPAAADKLTKSVGLIDTSLASPDTLNHSSIVRKDFVSSTNARPNDHGTAIASILVGQGEGNDGLTPKAHLYAASVFENLPGRPATATTVSLVRALDWMAANGVGIVNMSLTGPQNDILEGAIERARKKGVLVVAAIGNDGPSAKPLYPAGYESVVAVTATDRNRHVFRLASRGPQLDFAAPGVDIIHVDPAGKLASSSGTSLAVPFVVAALLLASDGKAHVSDATLIDMEKRAIDLGKPGFDPVYGNGFIKPLP